MSACPGGGTEVPGKEDPNYKEAVSIFYVGLSAVEVGDFERAKTVLDKGTEILPGEAGIWNNLGVLGLRLKNYEMAEPAFETATNLAAGNKTIAYNKAIFEVKKGGSEDLKEVLTSAVETLPDEP